MLAGSPFQGTTLSDWLHNLPVGWMTVVFFGCAYLSAVVIYAVVVEFPTSMWVRARLFATGAAACFLLIGAYDRPFIGQLSIRPDPLLQVMPETSGPSVDVRQ